MNLLPNGQFMGRGLSFKCMKLMLFTALNNSVVFTQTDENEFRCILTISSRFGADPMGRKKNTLLDTRTGRVRDLWICQKGYQSSAPITRCIVSRAMTSSSSVVMSATFTFESGQESRVSVPWATLAS